MNASSAPNETAPGSPARPRALAGGGEPPYDGGMDKRLTTLEAQFAAVLPTLATKSDIAEVRTEIAQLRTEVLVEMQKMRLEFQVEIAKLRADIEKFTFRITKWILATVISLFIGFAGILFAMSNILKPAPYPIQVPAPSSAVVPGQAPVVSPWSPRMVQGGKETLVIPPDGFDYHFKVS